jgi:hypothetical protein
MAVWAASRACRAPSLYPQRMPVRATARRRTANVLAAVATVIALYSAWHSIGHMHRLLTVEGQAAAQLTDVQRRQAPVTSFAMSGDIFDFFARYLLPGDRVYFQVMPSGYGTGFDLPQAVEALGRFYFLPAVQATKLKDATVVVSYFADPGLLHRKFVLQVRAGLQTLFVSRISAP